MLLHRTVIAIAGIRRADLRDAKIGLDDAEIAVACFEVDAAARTARAPAGTVVHPAVCNQLVASCLPGFDRYAALVTQADTRLVDDLHRRGIELIAGPDDAGDGAGIVLPWLDLQRTTLERNVLRQRWTTSRHHRKQYAAECECCCFATTFHARSITH